MGHQVIMQPELPTRNSVLLWCYWWWVLPEPPIHKSGHEQQLSNIKRKWYVYDQTQAGPKVTSKLLKDVAHGLHSYYTSSSPPALSMVSWGVPYDQLTEKKK